MRAYIIPKFGAPGQTAEVPTPEPDAGEILVRVKAASVNAFDLTVREGFMKDRMEHRFPLILGSDYAGTVAALGPGVSDLAVGDEVFGGVGKSYAGAGSYAEYVTASGALAVPRPTSVSVEVAAALPLAGTTALAEVDAAALEAGQMVLIIGAGGGVGAFAVQLAARRGARVIAVTSEDKADAARKLGATEVLNYAATDLDEQIRRLAPNGVAALIDHFHDAEGLVPLAELVSPGGRVVSPIAYGGEQALAAVPVTFHSARFALDRVAELAALAAQGVLEVPVETFPLARAGEALARQATRQAGGKLVVRIA